jgi:hypothetical protein
MLSADLRSDIPATSRESIWFAFGLIFPNTLLGMDAIAFWEIFVAV